MATPLSQYIFQPSKLDEYLDEIGLGSMSPEARVKLVDDLTQIIQYRIVTEVYSSLSAEEKLEYMGLMQEAVKNNNFTKSNEFLFRNIPDIDALVDEIVEEELEKMRPGAAVFRKVTDEFIEHLKKRKQYETDGEPILPLDASKIPASPNETPTEAAGRIADRPLEAPLAPKPEEAADDSTFPWESPTDTSVNSGTPSTLDTSASDTSSVNPPPTSSEPDSSQAMTDELSAVNN